MTPTRDTVRESIIETLTRSRMESSYKAWLEELREKSQIQILY